MVVPPLTYLKFSQHGSNFHIFLVLWICLFLNKCHIDLIALALQMLKYHMVTSLPPVLSPGEG